jgi:two-component system chemotaxis sensor kinase CheA
LFVAAGESVYGITRNSVIELIAANNANVRVEQLGGTEVACVRDIRMPYARLEDILGISKPEGSEIDTRTFIVMRPAVGPDFVLDVAKVIDTEELVVKPGAPIIMASGLYSGISLPDMGKPMLLLDASGIAAKIDTRFALYTSQIDRISNPLAKERAEAGASALLFNNLDGKRHAIRLSAIERMEDINRSQIHTNGGQYFVSNGDSLTNIVAMDVLPDAENFNFLKLNDGSQAYYMPVADILDIFSLPNEIKASPRPDIYEGVIMFEGQPVELINCFQFFATNDGVAGHSGGKAKLFLQCGGTDHWERHFLAPMLKASGYEVSFDDGDQAGADLILNSHGAKQSSSNGDDRILQLRDDCFASADGVASVYRYDRIGILSAMTAKLAGRA